MSFLFLLISVLLHRTMPIFCANEIKCPLQNIYIINDNGTTIQMSDNGSVRLSYERDNLAIYRYKNSQFINFLVLDANITFNGTFSKEHEKNVNLQSTLNTNIEGLALRKEVEPYKYALERCKLDLKKNTKFSPSSPLNVQEKIVEVAHACIQKELCSQFGTIDVDDYIRAKIEPHNFGEMSIEYITVMEKYPNLEFPENNSNGNDLQKTVNVLVDFCLASLITHMSGKKAGIIDLPDFNQTVPAIPIIKQGTFALNNGSFGNLSTVRRSQDFKISNNALEFGVEGEFELANATIHFDKYYMKFGVSSSGKLDINIDRVKFEIKVAMNYNNNPCETSVVYLNAQIGEISIKLSEGSMFDKMISSIVNSVIRKYIDIIINLVKTKIKQSINATLNKFNCETYRP